MIDDTIAAIATAVGEAGLSVIRISGPEACIVAERCFKPIGPRSKKPTEGKTHTVHYGQIVRDEKLIDEVLLTVLRAPRTFTKEDVVEVSCHGGIVPTKLVLDTILSQGARLAEPGEFTKRAFLNGRIDLTQAEAVADIIHSKTDLALRAANEQLAGRLSQRIEILRDDLINVLAHVEAHIDFPDEDIAPDTKTALTDKLERGIQFMDSLLATAPEGQILRQGVRTAIIGRPNAGKSSLLNCFLGKDRAIVSETAGTTRDTIEETANIRGIPIVFIDTAGLRESADKIEQEGIRRSQESLEQADLIIHVIDASQGLSEYELNLLDQQANKTKLIALNKSDLPAKIELPSKIAQEVIPISCETGAGLEALKDQIRSAVWKGQVDGEMLEVMINSRHQDALLRAKEATQTTAEAIKNDLTLELVALDLRIAVNAIGEIVGKTTTDDLLDKIFSEFCLGK
jgi:tRNA modification GTPase